MENILPAKTNPQLGIQLGNKKAPVVVQEFVNLSCPFCLQWFHDSKETYEKLIEDGVVRRVIKLYDKEKASLQMGNVMHRYVPKNDSYVNTIEAFEKIYAAQSNWGVTETEVAQFAENELGLTEDFSEKMRDDILEETRNAGIRFIPTMIIGEHVFDQKISQAKFLAIIEKEKNN